MGSIPIRTAMSKRYSESLVQDLNNGLGGVGHRKCRFLGLGTVVVPLELDFDSYYSPTFISLKNTW